MPSSLHACQNGIPVVAVEAGVAQLLRVLREGDRPAALGGDPAHLLRAHLGVPQRRQGEGDEPTGVGAAPLVDVPVVVGLEQGQGDGLVVVLGPQLAGEPGHRREVERPEHAVGVHVAHPLDVVVATGAHLGERLGVEAVLGGRAAGDGVEADVGQLGAVVGPHVDAVVALDQLRRLVPVLGRQVRVPHAARLDDVVVDRDQDEVVQLHGGPPVRVGQAGGPGRADGDVRCERPVGWPGNLDRWVKYSSAGWSPAAHRGGHVAGSGHDVVVRGGTVVDGTGAPARTADVAIDDGQITAVGRVDGRGAAGDRRRRRPGHPRLGRHPHPLRRPGHLGPRGQPVVVARRHHRRHGQLRRGLRARCAAARRTSSSS